MHQGNQKTVHHKGDSYVNFAPFLGRSPFTALIVILLSASMNSHCECAPPAASKKERIIAAIKAREEKTTNARFSWTETCFQARGTLVPNESATARKFPILAGIPKEDVTYQQQRIIAFDGASTNHVSTSWLYSSRGHRIEQKVRSTFDGTRQRSLKEPDVEMAFPYGRVYKASDVATDLDLLHLEPIFACYSLTSSHRSVLNLDSCYVEVEPTFLDSRPLVVLNGVSLPDGAGIRSVFVDEADECLIRRIVVGSRDAMQCQTDLFYKKSESGDSVVSGWKISKFGEDGAVISTVESVVTNAEFNLSLDRSEFTIDFPAGTYVDNLAGPQNYIVRSDGSKRLIAGSENDKSYEELLKSH
jgi:hypothetical protein